MTFKIMIKKFFYIIIFYMKWEQYKRCIHLSITSILLYSYNNSHYSIKSEILFNFSIFVIICKMKSLIHNPIQINVTRFYLLQKSSIIIWKSVMIMTRKKKCLETEPMTRIKWNRRSCITSVNKFPRDSSTIYRQNLGTRGGNKVKAITRRMEARVEMKREHRIFLNCTL